MADCQVVQDSRPERVERTPPAVLQGQVPLGPGRKRLFPFWVSGFRPWLMPLAVVIAIEPSWASR